MNRIISHTEYLLRKTDCVTLPGFGAFIMQHEPAWYDDVHRTYHPPYNEVVFNPSVTHNDGMLCSSIARQCGIGYDEAMKIVSEEVASFKTQLSIEKELVFGYIGSFREENGRYIFSPGCISNIMPEVNISTIAERESADSVADADENRITLHPWLRPVQWAATVIILFVLGIMLSTPISVERYTVAFAGSALPEIQMPKKVTLVDSVEITFNIASPADPDSKVSIDKIASDGMYALCVASLASDSEAAKFIAAHPGYSFRTMKNGQYTRVIAASSDSQAELAAIAAEPVFRKNFPEVWTFRNPDYNKKQHN